MNLNADFTQRAAVHAGSLPWQPSPTAGVDRRMLDRIGGEVARATTIVRYAPNSRFPAHIHGGGEEFLVLDGVFQDEHGDFPAGSYIRNPPESRHTPGLRARLHHLRQALAVRPRRPDRGPAGYGGGILRARTRPGRRRGGAIVPRRGRGRPPGALDGGSSIDLIPEGGIELLVLEGGFTESGETFGPQSWLRLPPGAPLLATVEDAGCRVWVKEGHLADPRPSPASLG